MKGIVEIYNMLYKIRFDYFNQKTDFSNRSFNFAFLENNYYTWGYCNKKFKHENGLVYKKGKYYYWGYLSKLIEL